ncbi:serine hydrolase [Paenibacillus hodogayensis]|uniref:Serine hydrolase n=1 Tax=Paenibacillus hodogayensis TaxID=279208 RepID=A0ABV5VVD9_9BACL
MTEPDWKLFEDDTNVLMEKYRIPGIAVAVARHGQIEFERGFGVRDEAGSAVTPDTVFGIASITKSFTCMAILQLQEAGKLKVTDPVVKYLPEFRTPNPQHTEQVAIHHLMTHTAGLPPLPTVAKGMVSFMNKGLPDSGGEHAPGFIHSLEHLLERIGQLDYELLGPPGTEFSYSNDGFALLGGIAGRVSAKPFADLIEETIAKPAGMMRTVFDRIRLPEGTHTTDLFIRNGQGGIQASPHWEGAPAVLGSGFLWSTLSDLMRYMELFRTGGTVGGERILSEQSVREMLHPHAALGIGNGYGYGMMVLPNAGGIGVTLIGHNGGQRGISSRMSLIPEKGLTGVVLTNLADVPASRILRGAMNAAQGLAPSAPLRTFPDFTPDPGELDRYAGTYQSMEGGTDVVTFHEGVLRISPSAQAEGEPLRPFAPDLFTVSAGEEQLPVRFIRNRQGNVVRVLLRSRQLTKINDIS